MLPLSWVHVLMPNSPGRHWPAGHVGVPTELLGGARGQAGIPQIQAHTWLPQAQTAGHPF